MRRRKTASGFDRQGSALIPVLILMVGLISLTTAFFNQGSGVKDEIQSSIDDERAKLLAEAALTEAVTALRAGATGQVGEQALPAWVGKGVFWVDKEELPDDNVRLVATAMAGSGRYAMALVVHRESEGLGKLFRSTLTSKETMTLNADVLIDSYDSSLGTYASQVTGNANGFDYAGTNGDARSNEDVVMNTGSTVIGDAIPGPGHSVMMVPSSYVHGSTTPASNGFEFPVVETPSYGSSGPMTVAGTTSLPSGDYEFDSLTINKDSKLTVTGPANIVVPTFTGGKNARLVIDATAGPVTIYCENYVHTAGFTSYPVDGSPMALAFLVTGPNDIVFPAGSTVNGGYYAEQSNIVFSSSSTAYGAFVAGRIDMSSGMKFHYDEALATHWAGGGDPEYGGYTPLVQVEWRVPSAFTADRRDPLLVLGLDPGDLPAPPQAWHW